MATVLTITQQAETATLPPALLLQVTGAPNPPAMVYASSFAAGVDGWTNGGSAVLSANTTRTPPSLSVKGPVGTTGDGVAQRALTGLTVGQPHRFRLTAAQVRGDVKVLVKDTASGTVLSTTAYLSPAGLGGLIYPEVTFTPTAADVTLQVIVRQTMTLGSQRGQYDVHTITVQNIGAWQGTTIYRTDQNGTDVPVREAPGGQDVAGGTMTVTDWEAALVGEVSYRVVDGLGGTATALLDATANTGSGVWLTLPATANPAAGPAGAPQAAPVQLVTGFSEEAVTTGTTHQIIGRPDKIANPGPLSTRSGTVECWTSEYVLAKEIRALLATGEVAMLRQPTFQGMDAYFVTGRVAVAPHDERTDPRRWSVAVDYDEVVSP